MKQESSIQQKNYLHDRKDVVDILKKIQKSVKGMGDDSSDRYFEGYLKGVAFALDLLESEYKKKYRGEK